MSSQLDDSVDADSRLHQVLADYLEAVEEGRPTNRQLLLAEHPELADELRAFFDDRDFMKRCAGRMRFVAPTFIGKYQVLEEIGSGAFGVVVKARHPELPLLRAIKLFRGKQGSACAEARKAAMLKHPNIVQVHEVGEHEGRAYYMMDFIEGLNLAERLKSNARPKPLKTPPHWLSRISRWLTGRRTDEECRQRWTARLVARIARGVHHAHQHGVIHRDLKPGNILIDGDGEPHITDFDLAKLVEEDRWHFELGPVEEGVGLFGSMVLEEGLVPDTVVTDKGLIIGTAAYMSPEQAAGQEPTTASDVYSLGVILYEMLTGEVPIRGVTPQETIHLIQEVDPLPPRSVNPSIDYRLERICRKCLQKNPEARFGSALGVARNLERWLDDEPLIDPLDPFSVRCRLWCRRNPVAAGLLVTAAALFLFATLMVVWVSRARAERLEEEVLKSNAYAAQGVASTVLLQFRERATTVYRASESTELRRLLEQDDRAGLQQFLERTFRTSDGSHFEGWIVLDREGSLIESSHQGGGAKKADKRDYFLGALQQADQPGLDSIYVSRAYCSSFDGKYKISFGRALRDNRQPDRPILCVISASITTDATMGLPQLHDERRKAVLVGPEETTHPTGVFHSVAPEKYLILLHSGYKHAVEPIPIPKETLGLIPKVSGAKQLSLPDAASGDPRQGMNAHYHDPVAKRLPQYAGRWLAGFAPVGNTEYVVIVQHRYEEAILADHGIIWTGAAILVGGLLILAIGWFGFQWFFHSWRTNESQPERAPTSGLVRQ
ncbi:hypothetical protein AYO44_05930 [Planctomycetaceae bacterium SCGC AG-212-F19]|nr:hypothetical protein AYO44_05930 [Planctomycetaceae bacterium SCGC AG-212-F19]